MGITRSPFLAALITGCTHGFATSVPRPGVDFGEQLHAIGENRLLAKDLVTFGEKCPSLSPREPEVIYEPYLNLGAMSVWLGTLDPLKAEDGDRRERLIRFRHEFQEVFWMLIREGFFVSAPGQNPSNVRQWNLPGSIAWPLSTLEKSGGAGTSGNGCG